MNRVFHHRVVDQHEAHPFPEFQYDRFGVGKFLPIESPDVTFHIPREVELDLPRRWSSIRAAVASTKAGVGQTTSAISGQSGPWIVQPLSDLHCHVVALRSNAKMNSIRWRQSP